MGDGVGCTATNIWFNIGGMGLGGGGGNTASNIWFNTAYNFQLHNNFTNQNLKINVTVQDLDFISYLHAMISLNCHN